MAPRTLTVVTITRTRIPVDISDSESVEALQAKLERLQSIPAALQVLWILHRGDRHPTQLCQGGTLQAQGLQDGDEVVLQPKLPELGERLQMLPPPPPNRSAAASPKVAKQRRRKCGRQRRVRPELIAALPSPPRRPVPPPPESSSAEPAAARSPPSRSPPAAVGSQPLPSRVVQEQPAPPARHTVTRMLTSDASTTMSPATSKGRPFPRQFSPLPPRTSCDAATSPTAPIMTAPTPPSSLTAPAPSRLIQTAPALPASKGEPREPLRSQPQVRVAVATAEASPRQRKVRRADLERVGRLGSGAFGLVTLEVDRRTDATYALKAVSKGYLQQLGMQYSVINEKLILSMVDSAFIVRLVATYNGREHVYFLLEAALGGELFTTYERLGLYGSEKHARFYVACVTQAFEHLHLRNVIYRDLKPENLLLDARGYCKLTDMGLAKVSQGQTFTLVGTPDYMAPEVIMCTGHTTSVDWWMLGVLLFELLCGKAPFEHAEMEVRHELVKRGIEAVEFPAQCRGLAADLVCALCKQRPEARIRVPQLRDHHWFRHFDWQALVNHRLQAPYLPGVRGPRDLANFRHCSPDDPPAVHYVDDGSRWDEGFEDDIVRPS